MSVIWADSGNRHSVFDAVDAVAQALEARPHPPTSENRPEELFMGDGYLAENVGTLRGSYAIDPWRVADTAGGPLGQAFNLAQRVIRRLTWWYTRPQIDQISRFNAAAVRSFEGVLARILRLSDRVHALEATHTEPRMRSFEEQLKQARDEQERLHRRITELETRLRDYESTQG
jgi:hypothetical protein